MSAPSSRAGSLAAAVKTRAAELGFHLVGIASAEDFIEAEARFVNWVDRGLQAEMGWITRKRASLSCRPRELLAGAQSIVVVGVSYYPGPQEPAPDSRPRGRVARYAGGLDYHDLMKERLGKLVEFMRQQTASPMRARVFVDTAPLAEREAAVRAGLGFYGKNTVLIAPRVGSWIFLGAVVTDLELEPDQPLLKDCGQCRLCIDACPTAALDQPYTLDAQRCISYLTIEHRGSIAPELRPLMGDRIFGCDICQEVCPWNRHALPTTWDEFRTVLPASAAAMPAQAGHAERSSSSGQFGTSDDAKYPLMVSPSAGSGPASGRSNHEPDLCRSARPSTEPALSLPKGSGRAGYLDASEASASTSADTSAAMPVLTELLQLDEPAFRARYRRSPIKRAKLGGLLRNAAIALGNSGDPQAVPALRAALRDSEPLVRAHAAWALGRLGGDEARAALEEAAQQEDSPQLQTEIRAALWTSDRNLPPRGPGAAGLSVLQ